MVLLMKKMTSNHKVRSQRVWKLKVKKLNKKTLPLKVQNKHKRLSRLWTVYLMYLWLKLWKALTKWTHTLKLLKKVQWIFKRSQKKVSPWWMSKSILLLQQWKVNLCMLPSRNLSVYMYLLTIWTVHLFKLRTWCKVHQ